MFIIFEGFDKTGKTTLIKELLKRTKYKHIVWDRGPVSQYVFDLIFDREPDDQLWQTAKILSSMKNLVVLCEADSDIIKQRLIEANEDLPKELEDIDTVKAVFRLYTNVLGFNKLILDTTNKSIDECVEVIVKAIEEIENDRSL